MRMWPVLLALAALGTGCHLLFPFSNVAAPLDAHDGSPPDVAAPHNRVFVSSEVVEVAMGGVQFADSVCQRLAETAGLPGQYIAWLSTLPSRRRT